MQAIAAHLSPFRDRRDRDFGRDSRRQGCATGPMDAPAQVPPAAQGPPTVTPPLLPQTAAAAQTNPIVAAAQLRQPFPNVQMPTFSNLPTEKVQNYLEDLEMTQHLLQWSAEELFQAVQFCLRGDAKVWLRHVPAGHKCDYPSLKGAMLDRFHTPTPDWRRIFTLSEVRQQDNEHPKEYAQRIRTHVGNAHVSDSLLTGAFVQGLQSAVKTDVAKANPPSFSEAVSIASRMYAINKSYGTNSSNTNSVLQAQMTMLQSQMSAMLNMCQSKYDHPPPQIATPVQGSPNDYSYHTHTDQGMYTELQRLKSQVQQLESREHAPRKRQTPSQWCDIHHTSSHNTSDCRARSNHRRTDNTKCTWCHKTNHTFEQCYALEKVMTTLTVPGSEKLIAHSSRSHASPDRRESGAIKGSQGIYPTQVRKDTTRDMPNNTMDIPLTQLPSGGTYMPLQFSKGVVINGLMDTGATNSYMSASCFQSLPPEDVMECKPAKQEATVGNGEIMHITKQCVLRVLISGRPMHMRFAVSAECAHEAIVGWAFMKQHEAKINCARMTMSIKPNAIAKLTKPIVIPPVSEINVMAKLSNSQPDETEGICSPLQLGRLTSSKGILSAKTLGRTKDNKVPIRLLNTQTKEVQLFRNTPLAFFEITSPSKIHESLSSLVTSALDADYLNGVKGECSHMVSSTTEPIGVKTLLTEKGHCEVQHDERLEFDLDHSDLNPQQKKQFLDMLHSNRDAFALSLKELGNCSLVKNTIQVQPNTAPISSRPYRPNPKLQDILNQQIDDLLDADIIEPSNTRWRSPTILVRKKDNSYRMCIDYRALNRVTLKTPFPLPTAQSIFRDVAYRKPLFYSSLDFVSGFYQQEIEEESRPYTGFTTSRGNFVFKRTPFGLVNAPFAFSHLITTVLGHLQPSICSAYLDDILIYSTFESHIEHVNTVLTKLIQADLKLKPSKCEWAVKNVPFLGHRLTPEGIMPQPRLLNKVSAFATPNNLKTVRAFLGLTGYYRSFMPNYSKLARPLHNLTKKATKFEWSAECNDAFLSLKQALENPPILIHPDFSKPFVLVTDASDYAVGGSLGHMIDGIFRPCSFYTSAITGAALKYGVTEKEAMAVFRSLRHFHDLITGYKVHILTDHLPLKSIYENADKAPTARLKRWALYISGFDFTIDYTPGKTHYLADFLSRANPTPTQEEDVSEPELGVDVVLPTTTCHAVSNVNAASTETDSPANNDVRSDVEGNPLSVDNLRRGQQQDPSCAVYLQYLQDGALLAEKSLRQKVIAKADYLSIGDDGLLRHHPSTRQKRRKTVKLTAQIFLPSNLQEHVLQTLHADILSGGHVGRQALTSKVLDRFYWEGMYKDISDFVNSCNTCNLKKRPKQYPKFEMQKWQVPSYPFEIVSTDLMGPLKTSESGNKYIITYTCHLTCWTEAFAIPDASARTVANNVVTHLFTRYGVVKQLHSDRGANYCAQLTKAVTSLLKCTQSFTSGARPSANGRAERVNSRINTVISSYIDDNECNWDDLLPYALWAGRSVPHARTGVAPFTLLFGHEPVFPLDVPLQSGDKLPLSARDYLTHVLNRLHTTREMAQDHAEEYVNKMKSTYDKTAHVVPFQVGDVVYLWNPRAAELGRNKKGKFSFMYTGPYRLVQEIKPYLFQLRRLSDNKVVPKYAHSNRFKKAAFPYRRPTLNTPPQSDSRAGDSLISDSEMESDRDGNALTPNLSLRTHDPALTLSGSAVPPTSVHSDTPVSSNEEEPTPDDPSDTLYNIEKVIMGKYLKNGDRSYLIKWAGYTKPSWVRESAMTQTTINGLKKTPVKMLNKHYKRPT